MHSGEYQPPSNQVVIYGQPIAVALPAILKRFWVGQAILVTDVRLAEPGGLADQVTGVLGAIAETRVAGIGRTAPRSDVLRIAGALRGRGTEAIVAVGGRAVLAAAKAARICLTNNVTDQADMDRLRSVTTAASPRPFLVAIPTTLSGEAYTPEAEVTDEATGVRDIFYHKDLAPDAVLLDPAVTVSTLDRTWLAGGVEALARAIETWCDPAAGPNAVAGALYGARALVSALDGCVARPAELEPRLQCQIGAWCATQGAAAGLAGGTTQAIARAFGALSDVEQHDAACLLLAHVLRHDEQTDGGRQAELAGLLGGSQTLAGRVAALVGSFGPPGRLRDAGVAEDGLAAFAARAASAGLPEAVALAVLRAAW